MQLAWYLLHAAHKVVCEYSTTTLVVYCDEGGHKQDSLAAQNVE